jgi:hypothetical protein
MHKCTMRSVLAVHGSLSGTICATCVVDADADDDDVCLCVAVAVVENDRFRSGADDADAVEFEEAQAEAAVVAVVVGVVVVVVVVVFNVHGSYEIGRPMAKPCNSTTHHSRMPMTLNDSARASFQQNAAS